MSSKTLAVTAHAGRLSGAVIESSIGSMHVADVFDVATGAAADASSSEGSRTRLPVSGPFDRVLATVDAPAAAFRVLSLPFRDRRRVSQAVGPALEEHVPLSLDDGMLAWDFTGGPAAAGTTGASVLAAIADHTRLDAIRTRLTSAGIEPAPSRLLWTPSVVLAAYRRTIGDAASFVAVDVAEDGAIVARFDEGRVAALRILAPCDDELLLRNLVWTLGTMLGDTGARVVVGGRRGMKIADTLGARIAAGQVEILPAAAPVEGLAGRDWREWTALAGLLLVASGDASAPLLDFAPGAGSLFGFSALRELQGEAGPLLRWGAAAVALALIAVGVDYLQLFAERRVLASRAEEIYASAMPSPSGGAGRKLKMEMRLRELSGKADAGGAGGGGSPLALLSSLSRDVPKNLDVVVDQVEHLPPSAKVAGHAPSFEAVTKMQQALEKGGAFSRVEVKDVHTAVSSTGGVEFLLELTTAAPGATPASPTASAGKGA
jgi:hypothetical protein